MLYRTLRPQDVVQIDGPVTIHVMHHRRGRLRLGFDGPSSKIVFQRRQPDQDAADERVSLTPANPETLGQNSQKG
ncbi:MAG: hypothetical protein ACOY3P_02260 [Planctomycetota bacterium]